jgi:hypothetical protein
MQWEAFSQRLTNILIESPTAILFRVHSWEISGGEFRKWPETSIPGIRLAGLELDCEFGENVHAADLGRHPEFSSLFFDSDNGGLAADPALFAGSEFRRKD